MSVVVEPFIILCLFPGLDDKIAITTIEQISPFPFDIAKEECDKYSNAEIAFAQVRAI